MAITQVITALPTPVPARNQDPDDFVANMDARLAAEPGLVTEINTWRTQANSLATDVNADAADAANSAAASAASAVSSAASEAASAASAATAVAAPGTSATSTTSLTIGTGSKSLTIQTGKAFVVGMSVIIARTSDVVNKRMQSIVTSYDSGTGALAVDVAVAIGDGTGPYTDWTVSLVGATGATGAATAEYTYINSTSALSTGTSYLVDSTSSAFTVTLPTTPANNTVIQLSDARGTWGTNNVTVDRNGKNIVDPYGTAQAENLVLNQNNMKISLFYDGTNWRLI